MFPDLQTRHYVLTTCPHGQSYVTLKTIERHWKRGVGKEEESKIFLNFVHNLSVMIYILIYVDSCIISIVFAGVSVKMNWKKFEAMDNLVNNEQTARAIEGSLLFFWIQKNKYLCGIISFFFAVLQKEKELRLLFLT